MTRRLTDGRILPLGSISRGRQYLPALQMKNYPMHVKSFASIAVAVALHAATPVAAQTKPSGLGPTDKLIRMRGPDGRPCLHFSTMSQADNILSDTYHHYVEVDNGCPRLISAKLCYKNYPDSCQTIRIPPHDATTVMLGTMTGQPLFEYDFTER